MKKVAPARVRQRVGAKVFRGFPTTWRASRA